MPSKKNKTNQHFFRFFIKEKSQRGAATILIAFLVMVIVLLVAIVVANVMVLEIKMSREIGNSIPAFYAADSGAERCLYRVRVEASASDCNFNDVLSNGATFASIKLSGSNEINSSGKYSQTNRKVRVTW